MNNLTYGLGVTAIGMLIVFFGLIILIGLINLLATVTSSRTKEKKPAEEAQEAQAEPEADALSGAEEPRDDALIAVLTAAVAAAMDNGAAFTVRRVRRVTNAPAWQRAGRDEQIYSRF